MGILSFVEMTPACLVLHNGIDITASLMGNNASITYRDQADDLADAVTVVTPNSFSVPAFDDTIALSFGYLETGLYFEGLFKVNSFDKTRQTITTEATAVGFAGTIKEKKNKSYDNMTLKQLAQLIAKRNGLQSKSDVEIKVKHIAQSNKSDLQLLTDLAKEYNLIFQIKNDTLLLLKKNSDLLPTFYIEESECASYSLHTNTRAKYKSCKAVWHDPKSNKKKELIVGKGTPQILLSGHFKNEADAKVKAKAKLDKSTREERTGNITIYGQNIRAGGKLVLIGFGLLEDGLYSIKSVAHNYTSGGYTIDVSFENLDES